jgi:hypothetical protein
MLFAINQLIAGGAVSTVTGLGSGWTIKVILK